MRARFFLAVVLLSLGSTASLSAYVTGAAPVISEPIAILDNSTESLYPAENPWLNPEPRNGLLCHNDPVNKSDPEGLLELSNAFKKAYPNAAQRIESLDRRVNKLQLDAFKKFGQATPKAVDKALDPNSGPKVVDAKLKAFGEFTPNQKSNEIRISDKLLKDFEAGLASSRLLDATVLHETTHYLDDQDGVDYPGEEGELFEIAVYGSVQFK